MGLILRKRLPDAETRMLETHVELITTTTILQGTLSTRTKLEVRNRLLLLARTTTRILATRTIAPGIDIFATRTAGDVAIQDVAMRTTMLGMRLVTLTLTIGAGMLTTRPAVRTTVREPCRATEALTRKGTGLKLLD